jgi:hypothetical protein
MHPFLLFLKTVNRQLETVFSVDQIFLLQTVNRQLQTVFILHPAPSYQEYPPRRVLLSGRGRRLAEPDQTIRTAA